MIHCCRGSARCRKFLRRGCLLSLGLDRSDVVACTPGSKDPPCGLSCWAEFGRLRRRWSTKPTREMGKRDMCIRQTICDLMWWIVCSTSHLFAYQLLMFETHVCHILFRHRRVRASGGARRFIQLPTRDCRSGSL